MDLPSGDRIIEAVMRRRRGMVPVPKQPSPLPPSPAEAHGDSSLKFEPGHIIELIFAANHLAQFVITDDSQTCAVCGATGANMLEADSHHKLCKVASVWNAIDRFGVTKAVR